MLKSIYNGIKGRIIMEHKLCNLCPRRCSADRAAGKLGFCGAGSEIIIGRYGLHLWEEPCLSGSNGSGAVFFSHCTLRCVYCQNYEISTKMHGRKISQSELCEIFLKLQEDGAHNINLVTPTHFIDKILPALDAAKANGLNIPIIYNTSGYERVETLKMLKGYIDIYLPDFKYWRPEYAKKYSSAPDYPQTAKAAIEEMATQVLPAVSENGLMKRGLIVRHLLLPGLLYDAKKITDYLYSRYSNSITLSLMSQYTPMKHTRGISPLDKTVGKREYEFLCSFAADLGFTNAYIQDGSAAEESFIPEFYNEKN